MLVLQLGHQNSLLSYQRDWPTGRLQLLSKADRSQPQCVCFRIFVKVLLKQTTTLVISSRKISAQCLLIVYSFIHCTL